MLEWVDSLPLVPAIAFLLVVIYLRAGGTYVLGRMASRLADRGRMAELLSSEQVHTALDRINRFGAPIVALSFLTIGFQTAANLAAGVTRMPLRFYLPALAIGGFAWAVIYATVGLAVLALWWEVALTNPLFAGLLAFAAIALLTGRILMKRMRRREQFLAKAQQADGDTASTAPPKRRSRRA